MSTKSTNRQGYARLLDAWLPPDADHRPIGCMATSFTFDPVFFEEECLGRFVRFESESGNDGSGDGTSYLIEREEKLAQLSCATVLVDQHHASGSRSLRWDLMPARVSGILHAKISLLVWDRRVRVIIGSANLTEAGYRRNHEIFGVLDYFEGCDAPLPCLQDILTFLREIGALASPEWEQTNPPLIRWNTLLKQALSLGRRWGKLDATRKSPRVSSLLIGPARKNLFALLRDAWPDPTRPPSRTWIVSPFFDAPGVPNRPAEEMWAIMKQRGEATVFFDVVAEEIEGTKERLVQAPESLFTARPNRGGAQTVLRRLKLEEDRPLHAKAIWMENDQWIAFVLGSSNFTSRGTGLANNPNIEANLVYLFPADRQIIKDLGKAWLPTEALDANLRFQPLVDDEALIESGLLLLPKSFGSAVYDCECGQGIVQLAFCGHPPAGFVVSFEEKENARQFVTESEWREAGSQSFWRVKWSADRPPSGFRVTWSGETGHAWWPVNVRDAAILPPPEELRNLPLDVLIEVLTSAKPLHIALKRWLQRRHGSSSSAVELDPHKRVDTSSFILQRTRRVSWALAGLRRRLEQPVASATALEWRLRGPVGVHALAKALAEEPKHSELERAFLLTELIVELARVSPIASSSGVPQSQVKDAIRTVIEELRPQVPDSALKASPAFATYAKSAMAEAVA